MNYQNNYGFTREEVGMRGSAPVAGFICPLSMKSYTVDDCDQCDSPCVKRIARYGQNVNHEKPVVGFSA